MADQQWEYCVLRLDGVKEHQKFLGKTKGIGYNCFVEYCTSAGGALTVQLASTEQPTPFNPFYMAMSRLGGIGWELVSMQFRDMNVTQASFGGLLSSDLSATFKRVTQQGRTVDQPLINMG